MTHDPPAHKDLPGSSQADAGGAVPLALDRWRWLALAVVLTAGSMDLLDVTIVNVAIPNILRELKAEYAQIEWIVAGYVLGFAALLITGGRLGDIFGRKRLFLIGVAGFTLASALCGVAVNPAMLIGARFFEGAMAGLMVPQILAIIHVTFPPQERAKALGLWGGILGSASALGLVVGALLLRWNVAGLQWRPIFLVNVPIGILALIGAVFFVRESRSPTALRPDLVGMVLAVAAILMLVYPLYEGRSLGWPVWSYLLMAGSVVLLALFIGYERRRIATRGSPLVVLSLFRSRAFAVGTTLSLIFWIAYGGFFLTWTLYMQVGLGWAPLHAGLTAVSFALGAAAGAGVSFQVLTPRFGRGVLVVGALLNAAGFAGYVLVNHRYGITITSWQMVGPLIVTGIGFGLVVAPLVDLILTGVPIRDAGSGSGLLTTTQQLGMALGVALVGVLFFALLAGGSGRAVDAVTPGLHGQLATAGIPPHGQAGIVANFRQCVHDRSSEVDPTKIPASCRPAAVRPAPPPALASRVRSLLTRAGLQANAHNFSRSFSITLWYEVGIMIVVFLGLFALPHRVRFRDLDTELAELSVHSIPQPEH
jgi:EmrB/QacA subfamily drug resistance transporter